MAKWHYIDKNGNASTNTFGKPELLGLLKAKTVSLETRVIPAGDKTAGFVGGTAGGVGGAAIGGCRRCGFTRLRRIQIGKVVGKIFAGKFNR